MNILLEGLRVFDELIGTVMLMHVSAARGKTEVFEKGPQTAGDKVYWVSLPSPSWRKSGASGLRRHASSIGLSRMVSLVEHSMSEGADRDGGGSDSGCARKA